MRVTWLVVLLVACGNRAPDPDRNAAPEPREAKPAPPPSCGQPGGHVCDGDAVVECKLDGTRGAKVRTCGGRCARGACVDTCAVKETELVYVVDDGDWLSSFDPRKLPGDPFHRVGKLSCDPQSHPFSMAVDREGIAWVLYANGKLFRVSIIDAHCSQAVAVANTPTATYGMGFVTDGAKATTETLFVASAVLRSEEPRELGALGVAGDPVSYRSVGRIGVFSHSPELTGTGDGKLFAYFPDSGGGFVQELDREQAKLVGRKMAVHGRNGEVNGWAFAHFGGVFYIFVTIDNVSTVQAVHLKSGKHELVKDQLPNRIVGAGVSTCAPLLEQAP